MNPVDGVTCARPGCDNRGKPGLNIVGYGSFTTKSGRRQRYRYTVCRGTVSTNTGTAYSGLRCTRREFEQVASLRVEGVSLSATARVTGHARSTIPRWLERASIAATRFNDRMLRGFDLIELQADELCTFVGNKHTTVWLFATIEVSSRLWAGSVLGRRSDQNARAVINDVVRRGRVVGCRLIATDGFEYYLGAARGDGSYERLLKSYARIEVLVLDDWGLAPVSAQERRDLLEILEDRYGVRSTVVTSQLPVKAWYDSIGDPTLADGILDRLIHGAYEIAMEGESMRRQRAKRPEPTEAAGGRHT